MALIGFWVWGSLYLSEQWQRPPPQPRPPPSSSSNLLCLRATCKNSCVFFSNIFSRTIYQLNTFRRLNFLCDQPNNKFTKSSVFFPCYFLVTDPGGCRWPASVPSSSFLATKVLSCAWERWDTFLLLLQKIEGRFPFN